MVKAENEPAAIGFGANDLLILAPGKFVRVAATGSELVTPFAVEIAPAGMVFVRFPFTVMVALSVSVQVPNGGRLPPLKEKELAPGVPLSVPPHVPTLKFKGLAKIIPLGMLSVKAILVSVTLPGLIKPILIVEAEPPKTSGGSKPLVKEIERAPPPVTVNSAVSAFVGVRFWSFVTFVGGIVLTYGEPTAVGTLLVT
jgi:hypothetical protein